LLAAGTLARTLEPAGADSVAFTGRIGSRALATGAYQASLQATNSVGRSKPTTLHSRGIAVLPSRISRRTVMRRAGPVQERAVVPVAGGEPFRERAAGDRVHSMCTHKRGLLAPLTS